MTSAVKILSLAPCPNCSRDNHIPCHCADCKGKCPTCGGTGALVPGLRRECPAHESIRIGHKTLGDPFIERPCRPQCSGCEGTGWVLIPEAEQESPLFDLCNFVEMGHFSEKWHIDVIVDGNSGHGKAPVRLEALANALCQALGVE